MRSRSTLLILIKVNFGAEFLRDRLRHSLAYRACAFLNFQSLNIYGNGIYFVSGFNLRWNISE
ncbi:hypothetical protein H6F74_18340 [Trichocoleus sp. FACHB-90]|uniref:hypothetical protein n=1 Tax=Cyanophyceae TaxID=3028117 RepID=UPI0016821BC2|nr:hypothetical protein [Trichocoleus sp. FACHB-90]MBD1928190.1 hypothetical protein [Trichocoleus sp. FACHB-90]